jgi:hypothetical protein
VTIISTSIVVLEFKKKEGTSPPTLAQWKGYHDQLRGYVQDHRRTESPDNKFVADFVLVMYDSGRNYAVQKLTRDGV